MLLTALVTIVAVNQWNLYELGGNYPAKKGLLTTADEPSYFAPVKNFIQSGVWKDNSVGFSSYYQRTPGYGFVYLLCNIFGEENSFFILKAVQILFYLLSIFFLIKILATFKIKEKWIVLTTLFYILIPSYSGFTYYTLSESITPFFVLSSFYFALSFHKNSRAKHFTWFCLTISVLVMIRPQLILLYIIPSCYLIYLFTTRFSLKKLFIPLLILVMPFTIWQIRNYTVNNEFVGLHPIYHTTNNHLYRPIHQEMTNLFRIWEFDGARFHKAMGKLSSSDSETIRIEVFQELPTKIQESKFKPTLLNVFEKYQKATAYRKNNFSSKRYITQEIFAEKSLIKKVKDLEQDMKRVFWQDNYLIVPFYSLKKLTFSSYLNLYVFQGPYRGSWWLEILRYSCFGILFLSFTAIIENLFRRKVSVLLKFFNGGILFYLFYLCFIQRMNEERYYYILLPLLFLNLFVSVKTIIKARLTSTQ